MAEVSVPLPQEGSIAGKGLEFIDKAAGRTVDILSRNDRITLGALGVLGGIAVFNIISTLSHAKSIADSSIEEELVEKMRKRNRVSLILNTAIVIGVVGVIAYGFLGKEKSMASTVRNMMQEKVPGTFFAF